MKNKAFQSVLLMLLCISNSALGQHEGEKIRFHIAPLNLLTPNTGVLQFGIRKSLNQRLSFSLDHGFKMNIYKYIIKGYESERKNYRYSKTKAELKYFVNLKNKETWSRKFSYLSIEGMYMYQKYLREDDYVFRNGTYYRYAYSNIDRPVWVGSLKYGREIRYSKFVIDSYFGLGIRRLSITHEPFDLVEEEPYEPADLDFRPIERTEGVFYLPHVSLGVKFGYIIR